VLITMSHRIAGKWRDLTETGDEHGAAIGEVWA